MILVADDSRGIDYDIQWGQGMYMALYHAYG